MYLHLFRLILLPEPDPNRTKQNRIKSTWNLQFSSVLTLVSIQHISAEIKYKSYNFKKCGLPWNYYNQWNLWRGYQQLSQSHQKMGTLILNRFPKRQFTRDAANFQGFEKHSCCYMPRGSTWSQIVFVKRIFCIMQFLALLFSNKPTKQVSEFSTKLSGLLKWQIKLLFKIFMQLDISSCKDRTKKNSSYIIMLYELKNSRNFICYNYYEKIIKFSNKILMYTLILLILFKFSKQILKNCGRNF